MKVLKSLNRRSMKGLDRIIAARKAQKRTVISGQDGGWEDMDDVVDSDAEQAARAIDKADGFAGAVTELFGNDAGPDKYTLLGGDRASRGSGRANVLGGDRASRGSGRSEILGAAGDYNDGYDDGCNGRRDRYMAGGNSDEYNKGYRDGASGKPNAVLGLDMSSVSPYLSAFASGFGDDKKKGAEDEAAKRERALLQKEKEEAESRSRTTLWVVFGIALAGLLGAGTYMIARKK